MEILSTELIITLIVIGCFIAIVAFFLGKKKGASWEKENRIVTEKRFQKELALLESRKNEIQKENENLKQKTEKYLYFLVRLPESVKQLNSNLSFDEIVSSIIRLTKDLIDTDTIEVYIFNKLTPCLDLVAAFGSNRKKHIEVKLGDGVIGVAAENKSIVFKGPLIKGEQIEVGIPIVFKNNLIGVIGIGKIKSQTGNERRFFAMVADLAAVSIQNCEYITSAKEDAVKDALTGLYNKRYFFERAMECTQKALNYNFPISIFIFDIDHFKNYNDKNGHVQGDVLLKELSRLLRENTRATDTIARYGGEEFIVLLPNTEKANAMLYAEKIRKLIESHPFQFRENQPLGFVSISGGIASFPSDGKTIDEIIKNADKVLYESKAGGRNRIAKYEPFQFSSPEEEDSKT